MGWDVNPQWEATLGLFGTIAAVALFISPLKTFQRILANKSTEEFPSLPYASTFLNCAVWVFYCLPSITPNRTSPLITNAIGLCFQTTYLAIFVYYSSGKARVRVANELTAIAVFLVCFVGFTLTFLPTSSQSPTLGWAGAVLAVIMFGAPLSSAAVVLRTRSVEFMPLPLSLMGFGCSTMWSIYGAYVQDMFVIAPNALGMLLGAIQLIIYFSISAEAHRRAAYHHVEEDKGSQGEAGIMMVENSQKGHE